MSQEALDALVTHAHDGLYLTPDLALGVQYFLPEGFASKLVERMHQTQVLSDDHDLLHYIGQRVICAAPPKVDLVSMSMAASDLDNTYNQIWRALRAACYTAIAIMYRTNCVSDDDRIFPRVIPHALHDLRINRLDEIDADIMHRILVAEPWMGWMEKIRAQRQRTIWFLDNAKFGDIQALYYATSDEFGSIPRTKKRSNRATIKSIRRSTRAFERLGRRSLYDNFVRSGVSRPTVIEGRHYDYHLSMRPGLLKATANPYRRVVPVTTIIASKNGDRLCEVCMYFGDTPPLDYVLAVDLHAKSEQAETKLLDAVNVLTATRAFYADPYLPIVTGLTPETAPTVIDSVVNYARNNNPSAPEIAMVDEILRHAYKAFTEINRMGAKFLHTLEQCYDLSLKHYFLAYSGEDEALQGFALAQEVVSEGAF